VLRQERERPGVLELQAELHRLISEYNKHAKKYSKSYHHKDVLWISDFEAMALKTLLKNTLSKWGILSVEMQLAIKVDQAIIKDDQAINVEYIDNNGETPGEKGIRANDTTMQLIKEQQDKAIGK